MTEADEQEPATGTEPMPAIDIDELEADLEGEPGWLVHYMGEVRGDAAFWCK